MKMLIDGFNNVQDIFDNFCPYTEEDPNRDINILIAIYELPAYEGYAFVLFEKDGQLFEVNGSHCSCYGLEGQWEPEETTLEALKYRIENGTLFYGYHLDRIKEELEQHERQHVEVIARKHNRRNIFDIRDKVKRKGKGHLFDL